MAQPQQQQTLPDKKEMEEKIKQQKAFAKSMADRAKLKEEMLAEIATDKAKNINEINAE